MVKKLVITISIDVPDGVDVKVSGAPQAPHGAPDDIEDIPFIESHIDTPPWPDMTPAIGAPASVLHDTPRVTTAPQAPPGGHHGQPWKRVPGGVSARTGKAYSGFWACQERDCKAKP